MAIRAEMISLLTDKLIDRKIIHMYLDLFLTDWIISVLFSLSEEKIRCFVDVNWIFWGFEGFFWNLCVFGRFVA